MQFSRQYATKLCPGGQDDAILVTITTTAMCEHCEDDDGKCNNGTAIVSVQESMRNLLHPPRT